VHAALLALFSDGYVEGIGGWWFDRRTDWTEVVASQALPANVVGVALELGYGHSERGTNCFSISSNGNTVWGLHIVRFPNAGVALHGDAQNNMIGGDQDIGAGPLGQGNLISGNSSFGIGLWGEGTSFNTIQGNVIGTDLSGTTEWGGRRDGIHSNGANYNLVVDNLISGYGTGVYLCCVNDGSNTVRGNYIGTDARGVTGVGNRWAGVAIDRSGGNVVGPDNIIAHNAGPGIAVYSPDSLRNTITQNSIHDNGEMGIDLWDRGNTELAAPAIFDFDLGAGTVTGAACANCTVEIFSDSDDEGEVYEGQAAADGSGFFTFNKGASFARPHLTAIATDADGNTSEFSAPTSGISRTTTLQEGNNLPKIRLRPKRSSELVDNRIGGDYGGDHPGSQEAIYNLGLKWLRIGFWDSSLNWQQVEKSPGTYMIPAERDEFVNDMVSSGVNIVLSLGVGSGGNRPDTTRFEDEEEIDRYVDYVRFMVPHFKGRIRYYEIWNEPDTDTPWGGISLENYSELIKRAAAVIRQEYPEAKIVIGATGGWWQSEYPGYGAYGRYVLNLDYLKMLLKSGVAPLVDVISWHPFYGHRPDDPYYQNYPQMVEEIKDPAKLRLKPTS
jgi:parallel beta-helix repeat protein